MTPLDKLFIIIFGLFLYMIIGGTVSGVTWNRFQKKYYKPGDFLPHEAAIGITQAVFGFIWPVMLFFGERIWKKWANK